MKGNLCINFFSRGRLKVANKGGIVIGAVAEIDSDVASFKHGHGPARVATDHAVPNTEHQGGVCIQAGRKIGFRGSALAACIIFF